MATIGRVDPYDDSIVIPSALNMLLGAWLACSPFVLGLAAEDPIGNQIACGGVIALFACVRALRVTRTAAPSWANAALGTWLFVWALMTEASAVAAANVAICGALVVIFALAAAAAARAR
jgi:hypothetical protein